jgi:xanthine dehydrogenase accessory factor
MKADLLARVTSLATEGAPAALVTDIATGRQALLHGERCEGDLALTSEQRTAIAGHVAADRSGMIGESTLFVRAYAPAPKLVVVGAVHIAQALAPIARLAGFAVTVIDPRAAFVRSGDFKDVTTIDAWPDEGMKQIRLDTRTAVVTLTHDPKLDDPALAAALRAPVFYIGALGSRKTHAKRLARLADEGFGEAELARIHGPVGLDINAVSPAEIAVSIVAELVQALRRDAA